jgi:hypothetical protein
MKKVCGMIFLALMVSGFSRAEQSAEKEMKRMKQADCTVTLKGRVNLGAVEAEVSCTTTAATCEQASQLAASCIKQSIKTMKTIIY